MGASYKGGVELWEICERGPRDYFSSHGAGFLDNVLSLSFSGCVALAFLRSCLGYGPGARPVTRAHTPPPVAHSCLHAPVIGQPCV